MIWNGKVCPESSHSEGKAELYPWGIYRCCVCFSIFAEVNTDRIQLPHCGVLKDVQSLPELDFQMVMWVWTGPIGWRHKAGALPRHVAGEMAVTAANTVGRHSLAGAPWVDTRETCVCRDRFGEGLGLVTWSWTAMPGPRLTCVKSEQKHHWTVLLLFPVLVLLW